MDTYRKNYKSSLKYEINVPIEEIEELEDKGNLSESRTKTFNGRF